MSSIPFSSLPATNTIVDENLILISQDNTPNPGRTSRVITFANFLSGIATVGLTFTGIVNVPTPTTPSNAASKAYVDAAISVGGTPRYLYNNGYIGFGVTNDGSAASSSYWIAKAIDNIVNGPEFHVFSSQTNMAGKMYAKGNGDLIFGNNLNVGILRLNANLSTAVNKFYMSATPSGNFPILGTEGSDTNIGFSLTTKGSGNFSFYSDALAFLQFKINHTASAINYITATGGITANSPTLAADGTNTDVGINFATKGIGSHKFQTSSSITQFNIGHTASAVNYWSFTGAATANAISFTATGSDTNIGVNYNAKGTGVHTFNTNVIAPSPVSNTHLANKQYVDDAIAAASSGGTPRYLYHNSSIGFGVTNPAATTIASYWEARGVTTGGVPILAINSTDTNSSGILSSKGTGTITLANGSGNLAVFSNVASTINYLSFAGSATAGALSITATGTDTNIPINYNTKGGGSHVFNTNLTTTQLQILNVASAVNYLQISGSATGSNVALTSFGSDTNVSINYLTRNAGSHIFATNTSTSIQARIIHTNSAVNYIDFSGSATGNAVSIAANGSDTNIAIRYLAKGASSSHIFSVNAVDILNLKLNSLSLGTDGSLDDGGFYLYPRNSSNTAPRFRSRGLRTDGNVSQSFSGGIVLEAVRTDALPPTGKYLGSIIFGGNTDNLATPSMVYPASISAVTDAAWTSSTAAATAIVFNTGLTGPTAITTPNVIYGTEAARLTSGGDFLIGATSSSYTTTNRKVLHINGTTDSLLGFGIGGTNVANILANSTALSLRTESTRYISLQTGGNIEQLRIAHIASAVNYWSISGSTTGAFLTIAAAGSDTDVSVGFATKGGGVYAFNTNGSTRQFKIGNTPSAINYIAVYGSATGALPNLIPEGGDVDIGLIISGKGAGSVSLRTSSLNQFVVSHTASAINYINVTGAAAGNTPILSVLGANAAINLGFASKGVGFISFFTNTNVLQFRINHIATAVNYIQVTGAATGAAPQLSVLGTDTNIPLVLAPKGTGALQAQLNDATATGGNARGANAIDWQTSRASATQVASGLYATLLGGQSNTSAAQWSVVSGGSNNVVASGANGGVIAGGTDNLIAGLRSWCPGGRSSSDRSNYARGVWASGQFTVPGDAQSGEFLLRNQSTSATSVVITSDSLAAGTANIINLPNSATYLLKIMLVARQTGGSSGTAGDSAGWEFSVLIKRGASAAATAIVGTPTKVVIGKDSAAALWDVNLSADTTNGGILVSCSGELNKNINWVGRVLSVEVVG